MDMDGYFIVTEFRCMGRGGRKEKEVTSVHHHHDNLTNPLVNQPFGYILLPD